MPSSEYVIPAEALLELCAPAVLGGDAGVPGEVLAPGDVAPGVAGPGVAPGVLAPGVLAPPPEDSGLGVVAGLAFVRMNEPLPAVPTAPGVPDGELDGAACRHPLNVMVRCSPALEELDGVSGRCVAGGGCVVGA